MIPVGIATRQGGPPAACVVRFRDHHSLRLDFKFTFCSSPVFPLERRDMPDIDYIRGEIEHMRLRVGRQRKEILQLQRAGIPTASAETLLQRMLDKIDTLCAERDKLRALEPSPTKGKVLGGRNW